MKKKHKKLKIFGISLVGLGGLAFLLWFLIIPEIPKSELWPRWEKHVSLDGRTIDHKAWDQLLNKYLNSNHPSKINLMGFKNVTSLDKEKLSAYLQYLQNTRISTFNRNEQKAYWINFYNSLTFKVVLDHYPTSSILNIRISPGLFSLGPWDAKLVSVEGVELSLNDIEHRILRPIWKDNRIHYALNCSSMGCPNLEPIPFTAENTDQLLDNGAISYINHPRGVHFENGDLIVSGIYSWFQDDFEGSKDGVIRHLTKFAKKELAEQLRQYEGGLDSQYDWSLNE